MKKIILLFLVFPLLSKSQDCLKNVGGGACIVVDQNGKYGIKKKDKYIIPSYFDQLVDHSGKYFSVDQNGKWGLFDIKGHMLLTVAYNKITVIDAVGGIINGEGMGYNNLVITERLDRPASTSKVNAFICAGNNEVSIAEYLTFMEDIRKSPKTDFSYDMAMPDLSNMAPNGKTIMDKFLAGDNCKENYTVYNAKLKLNFDMPCSIMKDKLLYKYLELPITGITFKQAQRFCLWLTEKYNAHYTENEPYEMLVRLPRPLEWEEFATNGLDDNKRANGMPDSLNSNGCLTMNCKSNNVKCSVLDDQQKKYNTNVVPAFSFGMNLSGLYNVFGNVAEMTLDEDVCKGGSYAHPASLAKANTQIEYHGANPWLGFRIVVEYRAKKNSSIQINE